MKPGSAPAVLAGGVLIFGLLLAGAALVPSSSPPGRTPTVLQRPDPPAPSPPANSPSPRREPICNSKPSDPTYEADQILLRRTTGLHAVARQIYTGVLAGTPGNTCAARGLSELTYQEREAAAADREAGSWAERAAVEWQERQGQLLAGWGVLAAVFAAIFIVLLVLARLVTPLFVRPKTRIREGGRRGIWIGGLVLLASASASPIFVTSTSLPRNASAWWVAAPLAATAILLASIAIALPIDRTPAAVANRGSLGEILREPGLRALILLTAGTGIATVILMMTPFTAQDGLVVDPLIIFGVAAALTGVAWVGFGWGTALRLQVQVPDAGGSDGSGGELLLSRLSALGSERPTGIKVPGASDISALPESALTSVPTGTWATLLFNLLRVIRPGAPWRVVATFPAEDQITWAITRNGVTTDRGTIVVSRREIPAGPSESQSPAKDQIKDELLTACAGDVLITLAEAHPRLERGLCGARGWRSLALYAIAVRQSTSADRQQLLLQAAIDADGEYALAHLASIRYSNQDDPQGRVAAANRFAELDRQGLGRRAIRPREVNSGYVAYDARLLYNLCASWLNVRQDLCNARRPAGEVEAAWWQAAPAAAALHDRLQRISRDRELQDLVNQMRASADLIVLEVINTAPGGAVGPDLDQLLDAAGTIATPVKPSDRNGYYTRACYHMSNARRAGPGAARAHWNSALQDLEIAVSDPTIKSSALTDPYFDTFNRVPARADESIWQRYSRAVGETSASNFLDLPPFLTHAKRLTALGLDNPATLASIGQLQLAGALGVPLAVATSIIAAAQLATRSSAGVLQLLFAVGVRSQVDLGAHMREPDLLYENLVSASKGYSLVPTRAETIDLWQGRRVHIFLEV